jgi:hypothetical protein
MADGIRSQSYVSIDGERDGGARASCRNAGRKRHSFLSFPYVCPEPVLAKSSFLYKNGAKMAFSYLAAVLSST